MKIKFPTPLDNHQEMVEVFLKNRIPSLNDELFYNNIKELLSTGLINDSLLVEMDSCRNFSGNIEKFPVFFTARDFYVHNFGFSLLNKKFINDLSFHLEGKKVIDVCAGSGFLASQLQINDIKITAVDQHNPTQNHYGFQKEFTSIYQDNSIEYLKSVGKSFDSVIMSWPDYNSPFATEILQQMHPGQELIYIGESCGGCTADDSFWELLDKVAIQDTHASNYLAQNYSKFPSIHDEPMVFIIKEN